MNMTIMIDCMEGSYQLANYEPLRSLLDQCEECNGLGHQIDKRPCENCRMTGKSLYGLHSGDVAFAGNGPDNKPILIGIEVKYIEELITSILDQRLQGTQLRRMAVDYRLRWLLVYGRIRPNPLNGLLQVWETRADRQSKWRDLYAGHFYYSQLSGFLTSPSFTNLFIHQQVETIEEAAYWLTSLYHEWNKPWNSHKSMRCIDHSRSIEDSIDAEFRKSSSSNGRLGHQESLGIAVTLPDSRVEQNMKYAYAMPGVGYERAKAIASSFWDMEEMMTVSISDWAKLEIPSRTGRLIKLGTRNAERIYKSLHWPGKK